MRQQFEFTTVDRIFSKLERELKGTDINESDTIEYIGEALDQLKTPQVQEQAVAFIEVKDYHCELPRNFSKVIQINRDQEWTGEDECITETIQEQNSSNDQSCPVLVDCQGKIIGDYEVAYYRPYFDLKWEYEGWNNNPFITKRFSPVKLSDNTFFGEDVVKPFYEHEYLNNDAYTIVGTTNRQFRFNFKNGYIAISYFRNVLDLETGYPLVPDNISHITAISYYIKWKIAEANVWGGKSEFSSIAERSERHWLKYARQAKNYAKMPKTIDDYQDLMEQSFYLVPSIGKYYDNFNNLKSGSKRFRYNNI